MDASKDREMTLALGIANESPHRCHLGERSYPAHPFDHRLGGRDGVGQRSDAVDADLDNVSLHEESVTEKPNASG